MPKRLLELVRNYPYTKNTANLDLLPRPRFSTRRYDTLLVRIETELLTTSNPPAHNPLCLISEALKSELGADLGEHTSLWETIKKAGATDEHDAPGSYPVLSRIFADETLRLLSLVPINDGEKEPTSTPFSLYVRPTRRRSFSVSDKDAAAAAAASVGVTSNGASNHTKPSTDPGPTPPWRDWSRLGGFFQLRLFRR